MVNKANESESNLTVLTWHISSISSVRQVSLKDLGFGSDIPKAVMAYWKEHVVSTDALKPFGRKRKELTDYLAKHTQRGKLGEVVPPKKIKKIEGDIYRIQQDFLREKEKLKALWPTMCEEQVAGITKRFLEYKEIQEMSDSERKKLADKLSSAIKRSQPDWGYINGQIDFTYEFHNIGYVVTDDEELNFRLQSGLSRTQQGLYGELLKSVSIKASEVLEKLHKNDVVNRRTIGVVEDYILDKVNGLSFLDKRLKPLVESTREALAPLKEVKGTIYVNSSAINKLAALLTLMSSTARLERRLDNGEPLIKEEELQKPKAETSPAAAKSAPTPKSVVKVPKQSTKVTPKRPTGLMAFS